ncbi:MAG: hypothetical protein WAT36_11165, partial [Chromatiaceae bacterium]
MLIRPALLGITRPFRFSAEYIVLVFIRAESRIKGNTSTFIGVVMTKHFEQLSAEERATIMVMVQEGQS